MGCYEGREIMTGRKGQSTARKKSQPPTSCYHSNNNNIYPGSSASKLNGSVAHKPRPHPLSTKARSHSNSDAIPNLLRIPSLGKNYVYYVVVAIVGFSLYANTLHADFVHDDLFAIRRNKDVISTTPLRRVFENDFWGKPMSDNTSHKSYRPLCVLTFRLNHLISEFHPFSYHLVNVLLHSAVCVIFTAICHKVIFRDLRPSFFSGLLFALHPVHSEAVAGVVGRADVLSCLLFLLSFWAFTRCLKPVQDVESVLQTSNRTLALSLFLAFCALLVKEHAATVLAVCLAYDILVTSWPVLVRRVFHHQPTSTDLPMQQFITRSAILIGAASVFLGFRVWMLDGHLPQFSEEDNPASHSPYITTRFLTYSYLVAFNIWLLLCPSTLSYDWQVGSIPLVESVWDVRNAATLATFVLLGCLGLHFLLRSKGAERRVLACGLLFLAIPFLPASNLFIRVGFVVAERILYIPSLGFCILVSLGLWKLYSISSSRGLHLLLTSVTMATLLCLGWRTWIRNGVWESRETLFRSGLETLPHNAKMHYNFGNYLMDMGQREDAMHHFQETIRLYPNHVSANNNLGTLLMTDDPGKAEVYFHRVIELNPRHAKAYFNLANIHSSKGELEVAERLFLKALEVDPRYGEALNSMATLQQQRGDASGADRYYRRGLALEEPSPDLHNNYATFLMGNENYPEALHHYKECLALDPAHLVAMVNMARLFRHMNRTAEAEEMYLRALSLERSVKTLQSLAAMYYNTDRPQDAAKLYQEAYEVDPSNVDIQVQYAQVMTRLSLFKEAETFLIRSLQANPGIIELHRLLSSVYSIQNQYYQALHHVEQALHLADPLDAKTMADLVYEKANCLKGLNRLDDAQKAYEEALVWNPDLGSCLLNLGALHHLKGAYKQARNYYQRALELDPNNTILVENMAKLNRTESKTRKNP